VKRPCLGAAVHDMAMSAGPRSSERASCLAGARTLPRRPAPAAPRFVPQGLRRLRRAAKASYVYGAKGRVSRPRPLRYSGGRPPWASGVLPPHPHRAVHGKRLDVVPPCHAPLRLHEQAQTEFSEMLVMIVSGWFVQEVRGMRATMKTPSSATNRARRARTHADRRCD
jgi:hypothetical protein